MARRSRIAAASAAIPCSRFRSRLAAAAALTLLAGVASAVPGLVTHNPSTQVFNQPAGVTGREPEVARDGEAVEIWAKLGPSFTYDRVFVYYTIDNTPPSGANGVPGNPSTRVMANFAQGGRPQEVFFQFNQPNGFGGNDDWWKVEIPVDGPSRTAGATVRYLISGQQGNGGMEIFANNGNHYAYSVKMPWPGAGAGSPNPSEGYPSVAFWKEEAFIGNTFTAAMLDQNGSWWDMYFPTPGGVQGVGTRNEGYSDGPDTFPPLLSSEKRGQMHLNIATVGIRTQGDGITHWLINPGAVSFADVQQQYATDETNTVRTTQTLTANGNNISVTQYDFAPAGIDFPDGLSGTGEQKHMLVKRMVLRNNAAAAQTVDVYMYMDPALNGGDTYDLMFWDASRGAMTVYDKTRRSVFGTGAFFAPPEEYNITTFGSMDKNIALYLTAAMEVQGPGGGPATDSWRDTSPDQNQGWIGRRVTLPPAQDVEVSFILAGAHYRPEPITDDIPANDGVYDNEIVPMLDWFYTSSMDSTQTQTDAYWSNWLANGTTVDFPDDEFDRMMKRGLLATALHQDGVHGGIVAGYHNGAYYYVWPRDAMWAAVTLARVGHVDEARKAIDWMRVNSYRDFEPWERKGFWKQKCTTDGFTVWGAPQIDGTAVFPWAVKFLDDVTGDTAYLATNYDAVRDAVIAMTTDSQDNRLRWEESVNLVYSNNLWEDSYDTFIYSNANVHRGLVDAGEIANILGNAGDAADAFTRAGWVKNGLDARLDWNGENTDISQLGIVYPFEVYAPTDTRAVRVIDRINGVANDAFGNNRPLVNFPGFFNDGYGWTDLINRYWGDGYWGNGSASTPWGAGPWFLTTMWYGNYYAMRQDFTPGTGDIDNHTYRLELLADRVGPMGLGAEQIAPRGIPGQPAPWNTGSLMYPGQNDFMLQTAWPNAWESMSFFVDSMMAYLDYQPDARSNTMRFEPKLPGAWPSMTFNNVKMRPSSLAPTHQIDLTVAADDNTGEYTHTFTNRLGIQVNIETVVRVPANFPVGSVTRNGVAIGYSYDAALGRVEVVPFQLELGAGATTVIRVGTGPACPACPADYDDNGGVDGGDLAAFFSDFEAGEGCADVDNNGGVDGGDLAYFFSVFEAGGC
jgi:GH15 family glucan-1,4-alpha-glucosidase